MDELKSCGEFEFIRSISGRCAKRADIILPIGDDTCALKINNPLLVSSDLLVEDVHFRLSHVPASLIGKKTAIANMSDIAAMGGNALYLLLSIAVPKNLQKNWLRDFMDGLLDKLNQFGVVLVGGDTSSSSEKVFINATILGESVTAPIQRSTASPGDFICISGYPGEAAAALDVLEKHRTSELAQKTHYERTPQLELGKIISKNSLATAMIDTSDGLVGDLAHLTIDFGMGAVLWEKEIPVSPLFPLLFENLRKNYLSYMLNGGEDYKLLFTSKKDVADIEELKGKGVFCIGKVTDSPEIILRKNSGEKVILENKSFNHFLP